MNEKDKIIAGAVVLLLLLSTIIFALQQDSDDDDDNDTGPETDVVLDSTMTYMESPKVVVKASSLHDDLNDGITNNDPFILDIRGYEDYANGHIPGAVNIPYRSVFQPANLATLPDDQLIVVVCYTGHTASQTTALLNTAGFDALALKWGFEGWATGGKAFDPDTDAHDYELITGAEPGSWADVGTRCGDDDDDDGPDDDDDPNPDPDPVANNTGNATNEVTEAADAYMAEGKSAATKANIVRDNLADGDASNDPFLLDIRSATDYEAGHIPGSINVPFASVFTEENLSKLPKDTQIVVVCYTGHTASQITALLNINGFDAIAMKWGFEGWSNGGKTFDPAAVPQYDTVFSPIPVANDYMAMGKSAATSATALHDLLNDGDDTNDPFVLDIRGMDDFVAGHIPGSSNIPFREVFKDYNLATLPTDVQIVVVCYTGHTASQATALLNMAGYDAIALKWGFSSWSDSPSAFDPATHAMGYDVETGAGTTPTATDTPSVFVESIAEASDVYLSSGKSPATSASSVHTNLEDGNTANDPFVLDIRGATDYTAGHVPGAVNVPYRSVFTWDNITLLPTDVQIVVVCYTGHTASQTTAMLNLAGYDAIALKWGFESWKDSGKAFDPATDVKNFDVVVGGTYDLRELSDAYMAEGKAPATSATALHDNLEDGDSSNDPYILDIRSFSSYIAGHIPGSVNVPFREIFDPMHIPLYPTDEQIVVVCYTGHTASQATALLNLAGYDAIALKWGFEGWTDGGKSFDPATRPDYPLETAETFPVESSNGEAYSNDIAVSAHTYLGEGKSPAMSATSLYDNLEDGDSSNDPFILDIRNAGDYDAGHVTGSMNIPYRSVFSLENITQLPDDTQIVVVCYTGHTASQTTAMLNLAGYDAIALKWGFEGWSDGGKSFDPATRPDFGVEVWYDLRAEADAYMAEGKSAATPASAVVANFEDGDDNNNPFVLDIRGASDYEYNHVPTAVNVPFRSVFTTENLSKLPMDKQIVVVCYTGHTASQITALLNVAGYDAIALKWGWSGWNASDSKVYNHTKISAHPEANNTSPDITGNAETSYVTSIPEAANDYLVMGKSPATSGDALNGTLGGMDEPFILDIRSSATYEEGHVPGAVNIPFRSVFTEENFSKLPNDEQIVVVCYSGHTASQTTALLNLVGLDAIALKWGYAGWIPKDSYPGTIADNNPMVSGTEPGDWP